MSTQSYEQLIAGANKIRQNELPESNTHTLVGEQLLQMTNKMKDVDDNSEKTSNKNKAGGYAGLDTNGKVAENQMPKSYQETSTKNVAGGYPGLDANAKIQDEFLTLQPITLSFAKQGDGLGIVKLQLKSTVSGNVTVANGVLCDNALGLNPTLVKSIIKNVLTDFYLKCENTNCGVKLNNLVEIRIRSSEINTPVLYTPVNTMKMLNFAILEGSLPCNLSGDIKDMPNLIKYIMIYGKNTISGDIAFIPSLCERFTVTGQNTISGDIGKLPITLKAIEIEGQNTVSGDIAYIPSLCELFTVTGQNTISGDIGKLPITLNSIALFGKNTVSGDIALMPSKINKIVLYGQNTVSGNISNIPLNVSLMEISGQSSCIFSGTRIWSSNMRSILVRSITNIFTSKMTDDLLISLSAQPSWTNEKRIDLRGNCGARTSASDAAVALLESYGVTVLHN